MFFTEIKFRSDNHLLTITNGVEAKTGYSYLRNL